jgi:hypothetical protein
MRAKTHHAHQTLSHCKLRGPDWALSPLMLDRALEVIGKRHEVIRDFHVPYLAGYSEDGKVIYIDRDLPPAFQNTIGDKILVDRYLMLHESVEKGLIDSMHLHYQHAHQIALRIEMQAVEADGIAWTEYDAFMQEWIKEAEESHSLHLPPDLDLRPYIDEHDKELLEVMRSVMRRSKHISRKTPVVAAPAKAAAKSKAPAKAKTKPKPKAAAKPKAKTRRK